MEMNYIIDSADYKFETFPEYLAERGGIKFGSQYKRKKKKVCRLF
jgi:hypothetical protein